MTQPKTSLKTLLLGLGSALLATACTVTLDPNGAGGGSGGEDAQCLELFETCVELAGDSPGCEAVFEFCAGPGGGEGGGEGGDDPGCEENYIECLASGVDPDACEPLLWECDGGGEEGGGCEDDPDGCEPPPSCEDDPDGCQPTTDCEELLQTCVDWTGEENFCESLLDACYEGDCDSMLAACEESGIDETSCAQLTGCGWDDPAPQPGDECDELLQGCYAEAGDESICQEIYPECFEGGGEGGGEGGVCDWYFDGECYEQFDADFCQHGGAACQAGLLPEHFECADVFPDYCYDVSDSVCNQAEEACWNGFHDIELCGSIADDPSHFIQELADCNGWE